MSCYFLYFLLNKKEIKSFIYCSSYVLVLNFNDFVIFTGNHVRMKNERGILQTLLCCFGKSRSRPNSSSFVPSNSIRGVNAKPERSFTPPLSPDPTQSSFLLPAIRHQDMHKKCMVIDLDETLVHSSFKVLNVRKYFSFFTKQ